MHVWLTAEGTQSWRLGEEHITSVGSGVVTADLPKEFEAFSLPNDDSRARGGN
jgi:hypothetical protein